MPSIVHSSSSEFICASPLPPWRRCQPTGSKWAKILGHRFSTVFPPFSTVSPGGPNRNSFEESSVRPYSVPLRTVKNGDNGGVPLGRLQRLGDRVLDTLEPDELHRLAYFLGNVVEVAAI